MKVVREHINEKFKEKSDPIKDMGIGIISKFINQLKKDANDEDDIEDAYEETIRKFNRKYPEKDWQKVFDELPEDMLNEKFEEQSDPIEDMGIGQIDLFKVYKETVVDGINRWYKFLENLNLIGKKVTFNAFPMNTERTIKITKITRGELPNGIYLHDETGTKWPINIKGKLIIH